MSTRKCHFPPITLLQEKLMLGVYSVFLLFRQAKFAYGDSILSYFESIFVSATVAFKNLARNKSGQN